MHFRSLSYILLLLFTLLIAGFVVQRVSWRANPNFMAQENYGLAYANTPSLGDLCSPRILAGLAGPLDNVTDHRSSSLIYVIPTKLFKGWFDIYTIQRVVHAILYLSLIVAATILCWLCNLHPLAALFFVVYYGLSAQALSLFFEFKLTLSSAVWFLANLCLFSLLLAKINKSRATSLFLVFFIPILAALSYETYCVSRPLAVASIAIMAVIVATNFSRMETMSLHLAALFAGTATGGIILKLLHPGIRFDHSLLIGRGESITGMDTLLRTDWTNSVLERLNELPTLFYWPKNHTFSSETPTEAGWLEVWVALFGIQLLVMFIMLAKDPRNLLLNKLREYRPLLGVVTAFGIIAFLIPFGSTTYLRGHRWFALYIVSAFFLTILISCLIDSSSRLLKSVYLFFTVSVTLVILLDRIPVIANWSPSPHYTPPYYHVLIKQLKELTAPDDFVSADTGVLIRACDHFDEPLWEHSWNAALYVSDFGCKVHAKRLFGNISAKGCDCDPSRNNSTEIKELCVHRSLINGEHKLELVY